MYGTTEACAMCLIVACAGPNQLASAYLDTQVRVRLVYLPECRWGGSAAVREGRGGERKGGQCACAGCGLWEGYLSVLAHARATCIVLTLFLLYWVRICLCFVFA